MSPLKNASHASLPPPRLAPQRPPIMLLIPAQPSQSKTLPARAPVTKWLWATPPSEKVSRKTCKRLCSVSKRLRPKQNKAAAEWPLYATDAYGLRRTNVPHLPSWTS